VKRFKVILVGLVFVAALLAFACAFTVRFTEAAVVTRFGQAGENAVKRTPGLYLKLPYPFESVTKYDTRVRTLALKGETQQTADSKQIVVEPFATWRVSDPLKFFRRFSNAGDRAEDHFRQAESTLDAALRSAAGAVSRYTMDDMFSTSSGGGRLEELEERMLAALQASSEGGLTLSDFGVQVEAVGLMRIVLPQETTKAVFQRMQANRERIAKETEARGNAEAQAIRSKADNDAKRVQDFADRLAEEIRTLGDQESREYIAQMNVKPELAKFQLAIDMLREAYASKTTLVLSSTTPGVGLLFPDALAGFKDGEVPPVVTGNWLSRSLEPAAPAQPRANEPATTTGGKP
jgi:modulator of FtsH protease HflC